MRLRAPALLLCAIYMLVLGTASRSAVESPPLLPAATALPTLVRQEAIFAAGMAGTFPAFDSTLAQTECSVDDASNYLVASDFNPPAPPFTWPRGPGSIHATTLVGDDIMMFGSFTEVSGEPSGLMASYCSATGVISSLPGLVGVSTLDAEPLSDGSLLVAGLFGGVAKRPNVRVSGVASCRHGVCEPLPNTGIPIDAKVTSVVSVDRAAGGTYYFLTSNTVSAAGVIYPTRYSLFVGNSKSVKAVLTVDAYVFSSAHLMAANGTMSMITFGSFSIVELAEGYVFCNATSDRDKTGAVLAIVLSDHGKCLSVLVLNSLADRLKVYDPVRPLFSRAKSSSSTAVVAGCATRTKIDGVPAVFRLTLMVLPNETAVVNVEDITLNLDSLGARLSKGTCGSDGSRSYSLSFYRAAIYRNLTAVIAGSDAAPALFILSDTSQRGWVKLNISCPDSPLAVANVGLPTIVSGDLILFVCGYASALGQDTTSGLHVAFGSVSLSGRRLPIRSSRIVSDDEQIHALISVEKSPIGLVASSSVVGFAALGDSYSSFGFVNMNPYDFDGLKWFQYPRSDVAFFAGSDELWERNFPHKRSGFICGILRKLVSTKQDLKLKGIGASAGCSSPLTPGFFNWTLDVHQFGSVDGVPSKLVSIDQRALISPLRVFGNTTCMQFGYCTGVRTGACVTSRLESFLTGNVLLVSASNQFGTALSIHAVSDDASGQLAILQLAELSRSDMPDLSCQNPTMYTLVDWGISPLTGPCQTEVVVALICAPFVSQDLLSPASAYLLRLEDNSTTRSVQRIKLNLTATIRSHNSEQYPWLATSKLGFHPKQRIADSVLVGGDNTIVRLFPNGTQVVLQQNFGGSVISMAYSSNARQLTFVYGQSSCTPQFSTTCTAMGVFNISARGSIDQGFDIFSSSMFAAAAGSVFLEPMRPIPPAVTPAPSTTPSKTLLFLRVGGAVAGSLLCIGLFFFVGFLRARHQLHKRQALAPDIEDFDKAQASIFASTDSPRSTISRSLSSRSTTATNTGVHETYSELQHLLPSPDLSQVPSSMARIRRGRLLGRGSYGSVYACRLQSRQLQGEFAIKVVFLRSSSSDAQREKQLHAFQREVKAMSLLRHANVVSFVGSLQEGNNLGIIMEKLDGSLRDVFKMYTGGTVAWFDEDAASAFVHHMASGLAYLHENLVAHRDVKPENVLVEFAGLSDVQRLVWSDFGTARIFEHDPEITQTLLSQTLAGTPAYLAPEEYDSNLRHSPFQADCWAFGIIVFELIVGRIPTERQLAIIQRSWTNARTECRPELNESAFDDDARSRVLSWTRVCGLYLDCTLVSPSARPTMAEVTERTDFARELLPGKR